MVNDRSQRFHSLVRSFLPLIQILAKIYDEFLTRKRKEMDTSVANEETFRRALELILEVGALSRCTYIHT